jgi:hypothetical protein
MPERPRDDATADDIDMIGDDENPADIPQINPLKGLMDPGSSPENSPAGETEAPPPPG